MTAFLHPLRRLAPLPRPALLRRLAPVAVLSLAGGVLALPSAAFGATTEPSDPPTNQPTDQLDESGVDGPSAFATLHQVRPSVLTPASESLTFTGTVTNNGSEALENVRVMPRHSAVALEERAEIREIAINDELYRGARAGEPFFELGQRLGPGESVAFELNVPLDVFGFGQAGVYAAGVDVRGSTTDGDRLDLDTARTVVPWLPEGETLSDVPVALAWPVAARPSLLPSGDLSDDALAGALSDGGYLDAIVSAAAATNPTDTPLSWMIDPDLLTTVGVMAEGYAVNSDGETTPGSGESAAAAWRRELDQAIDGGQTTFLPAARPDLDAAAETDPDLTADLARQSVDGAQDATQTQGVSARTDVVWADGSGMSEAALAAWTEAGARSVILPADAVEPSASGQPAEIALGDQRVDAVLTDPGLDSAIADADAAADPQAGILDLQQRWLAETAMVALDAAESDEPADSLVAAPPQRWTPDPAIASAVVEIFTAAPWVTPVNLEKYEPAGEAIEVELSADAINEALPAANLKATATLSTEASHYTSMLADAGDRGSALTGATLRSASTGWRDDPAAGQAYTSTVVDDLTEQINSVSVTVPETVTLSSSRGAFPLTVTNDLDEPVVVRLDIHADNVNRLQVEEMPPQRVEAGEKASITVTAQASSNGKVPIQVQLIAGDGAPLGEPQRMVVNATDYGTLGWIIVGAAGGVFALALVKRIIGRRRSDSEEVPAEPDDPSTTSSGSAERVAP